MASTITRTTGSVPEGRNSTRPFSPSSASAAATAADQVPVAGGGFLVDALDVDQHLRKHRHGGGEFLEGLARGLDAGRDVQAGEHAVAGGGVVGEDHVSGLFPAEVVAPGAHALEHVAVPHAGFQHVDSGLAHRDLQPEVAHHGGHQGVVLQDAAFLHVGGHDRHDLVPVHDGALVVNGQAAVGVAVVGDAQVRAVVQHGCLQAFKVRGAVAVVDVDAVGLGADDHHLGTGGVEDLRGAAAGSAVGAVQDDLQPVEPVGQGLQQVHDVAVLGVREATDPSHVRADRAVLGLVQGRLDGVLQGVVELLAAAGQELDPVVGSRVVRGGDHHPEVGIQVGHQIGCSRRRKGSCIMHIDAGGREPGLNGSREEVPTDPRVLGDHRHRTTPVVYLFVPQHHGGGL